MSLTTARFSIVFVPVVYIGSDDTQLLDYIEFDNPGDVSFYTHVADRDVQVRTWELRQEGARCVGSYDMPEVKRDLYAMFDMEQIGRDEYALADAIAFGASVNEY